MTGQPQQCSCTKRHVLLLLLLVVLALQCSAWQQSLAFPRYCRSSTSRLWARRKAAQQQNHSEKEVQDKFHHHQYKISFSPNFNRHLVSVETPTSSEKRGTNSTTKRTVIQSFQWLDDAQRAYPNATLETLDLPPPPTSSGSEARLLSRIVAGAGVNETSVYYSTNNETAPTEHHGSPAMNPNNGGTYLYRFLQKLYSTLPNISPAEIHRGVMDKFPRIAFYDAALVHERLFFLLSPLPPQEVLDNLRLATSSSQTKQPKKNKNHTTTYDDFPLLFHKYGYGAGLTKIQLVQALQSLPQYWLAIYLRDASSRRTPEDVLPYILYHLSSHPDALREINEEMDYLLTGTVWADIASLAHAKSSLQLTTDQCRILLLALPTLRTCDTEPNWEHYQSGPVREGGFMEESLAYLRLRLQLDPVQVFSLIKTHSRLSTYKVVTRLKPVLDALQSELQLESHELQQIILRMPSLLGVSIASLEDRIQFLRDEVGLTDHDMRKSVVKLPALLQYSATNLETKLYFFREELGIPNVAKTLVAKPTLWGLSVETNLMPTALALGKFFGMTPKEVGNDIIARAPELLLFNWKSNLEPKLLFLKERLDLTMPQLHGLITATPRILTYSLHSSLAVKIDMIEEHVGSGEAVKDLILERPSLLVTTKSALSKRLVSGSLAVNNVLLSIGNIQQARNGRLANIPRPSPSRQSGVLQLALDGTVEVEFESVKDAAAKVGTSVSNMYSVLRQGRKFRDMKYVYRNDNKSRQLALPTIPAADAHDHIPCLTVYTSGRVYPPDRATQARGLRQVGGVVVAIPSLPRSLAGLFEMAIQESYSDQVLHTQPVDGITKDGFVAMVGYSFLRASRRRCSLFACYVALRVITTLFVFVGQASQSSSFEHSCPPTPTHINIITDSNYVYGLLHNSSELLEWGSSPKSEDFVYTGKGSKSFANVDIIYPLSRAYRKLVGPEGGLSLALQENVTINFESQQQGATSKVWASAFREKVDGWANQAAKMYFERQYP